MKFNHNWKEKKWANYAIALCIAVFFYLVLSHINIIFGGIGKFFGFIKPVIYALIIAYILNPLSNLFERKFFAGMKRRSLAHILSVAITIILVVALLVLLIAALVPQLTSSAMTLLKNLSGYIESFRSFIDGLLSNSPGEHPMIQRLTNIGTSLLGSLENSLPTTADSLISTFSSIGSNIVNGVISFILAIYFLLDKNRLIRWFVTLLKLLFSPKRYREVADFWLHCNTILIRYIFSDLIDGLIIGLANFIFQMIAGLPYAVLISVVVGVTNLAPTLRSFGRRRHRRRYPCSDQSLVRTLVYHFHYDSPDLRRIRAETEAVQRCSRRLLGMGFDLHHCGRTDVRRAGYSSLYPVRRHFRLYLQ